MRKFYLVMCAAAALSSLTAQDINRRATMARGGPRGGEGCTFDIIVDGAAEVEIRGDNANVRNLSGQPPQIRQFECTRPLPPNAPGFVFREIDGRGRMELARTPDRGGPVVVRIDDPQGGQGEYRFEISWAGDYRRNEGPDRDREHMGYQEGRDRFFQGEGWRRNLFQRVREDVEHLQHSTFPFTGDQSRLARTILELNELQGKLSEGRYDEHELNDVLYALTAVLQNNRLTPQDRNILTDDLNRMRDFRDRHDDYGARYPRP